jgi:hypothetical protein
LDVINIPLRSSTIKPDWAEVTYAVKGAAASKSIVRLEGGGSYDFQKDDEITITFQIGNKPVDPEGVKQAVSVFQNLVSGINGNATAAPAKKEDAAAGATTQQADKTKSQTVDPENDPKVSAEAIAEHLALAGQIRRDADRWAADAAKETDPDRRKELQARATAMQANAQSEKDIAESLRTGTSNSTRRWSATSRGNSQSSMRRTSCWRTSQRWPTWSLGRMGWPCASKCRTTSPMRSIRRMR